MEGRRDHRLRVFLATVLVALQLAAWSPPAAHADDEPPPWQLNRETRTAVYTEQNSAVVEAEVRTTDSAAPPIRSTNRSCHLERVELDPGPGEGNPMGLSFVPPSDDEVAFWLICNGETVGMVIRKVGPPRPRSEVEGEDLVSRLREEIPMPDATIRVNPDSGLVGTESWFWIEGYSGQTLTHSTNAFGQTVEIEAMVTKYEWSFGDGATLVGTTPGHPYPARSEVRHTYERSSAGGYTVNVRFVFGVRYRLAGGAWTELNGITRDTSAVYPVRESQAVISR